MNPPDVIMIGGGKGGVGKSSVTAAVARALTRAGRHVGVIDADLAGPSQSILFSCGSMRAVEGRLQPALSTERIAVASIGLIVNQESALVWSDQTAASAVRTLTAPANWAEQDILLIDLPPGQGRITSELAQCFPRARALLVTTGSALALEECRRATTFLHHMDLTVAGLVENMAYQICPGCHAHQPLFDSNAVTRTATDLNLPVLARLPFAATIANGTLLDPVVAGLLAEPATAQGSR